MSSESNEQLEGWASNALAQLSDRRAPPSIFPRVMAAIALAANRPWYRRPWLTWPRSWQVMSVAATVLWIGAAHWITRTGVERVESTELVGNARGLGSAAWTTVSALAEAVRLCLAHLPLLPFLILGGVLILSWMGCLTLGTAFWQLASVQRSPRSSVPSTARNW